MVDLNSAFIPYGQQGHLYLIGGTPDEIARFAGSTVDWVIKMAHLLCDPLGNGRIYTHPTGTPQDWWNTDRDTSWEEVSHGDPLHPKIYEFAPVNSVITLSRICPRQTRSVTTQGTRSHAARFRNQLLQRDGGCVVTGTQSNTVITASHLIPRRVGDEGAQEIVGQFVGTAEATRINSYHPSIGIMLLSSVGRLVDVFQAGFYHNDNNTYTVHNFSEYPEASVMGSDSNTAFQIPLLHGFSVTLSVHTGAHPLPPPGVFNWHYLQCVVNRFGMYSGFPDICFFIYRFRTSSDSSDVGDFDADPPYPSYPIESALAHQMESHQAMEREKEILQWASGVPCASGVSE
ncbi:hypothetical protein EDB92DRAFT_1795832 [Lactarius akahatsu]|uniref:Uncharacterized protein n=1 Tax=Lactarius akahatsu TaxID=416441 RepID=A0AAD4LIN1_9AGAM|nr:hypothetical protein EDB92DRAFT_1795832 [Lactarius akahatsu]